MTSTDVAPDRDVSTVAPAVSVVVPTYNRRRQLGRVLEALASQDFELPYEVVVVSDGSTDGTNDYLTGVSLPLPVVPVLSENCGPAGARNRGIATARGELVVFIDDDVVAAPGLLTAHWAAHRNDDALVVIGPMLTPDDHALEPWIAWEQAMLERQYDAMLAGHYDATARQFYTGNASVRRAHLEASGGFDESFRRAEDVELAYRLAERGLRFQFEPNAIGYHYAHRSYAAWIATAYAYGRNDVIFARDHGQAWLLTTIRDKFAWYPAPVRWALRFTTSGRRRAAMVAWATRWLSACLHRVRLTRASRVALSGAYATEYYRGVAAEAGGWNGLQHVLTTGELDGAAVG